MVRVKHYSSYQPNGYEHEVTELQWKVLQVLQVLQGKEKPFYSDREIALQIGLSDGVRFAVAQALYYLKRDYLIKSLGVGSEGESFCLNYGERIERVD